MFRKCFFILSDFLGFNPIPRIDILGSIPFHPDIPGFLGYIRGWNPTQLYSHLAADFIFAAKKRILEPEPIRMTHASCHTVDGSEIPNNHLGGDWNLVNNRITYLSLKPQLVNAGFLNHQQHRFFYILRLLQGKTNILPGANYRCFFEIVLGFQGLGGWWFEQPKRFITWREIVCVDIAFYRIFEYIIYIIFFILFYYIIGW